MSSGVSATAAAFTSSPGIGEEEDIGEEVSSFPFPSPFTSKRSRK